MLAVHVATGSGVVLVFRQHFVLGDATECHAFASLEASRRVANAIPLERVLSYRLNLYIASKH